MKINNQEGLQHSHVDNYMEDQGGMKIRMMEKDGHMNATCTEKMLEYSGSIIMSRTQVMSATTITRLLRLDG